jgi:Spy/CpxP family protein refolding chaperone
MKMSEATVQQKASLWLGVVFVLGIALGGILGYAFAHRSYAAAPQMTAEERRAQKRARLVEEVALTAEQKTQIFAILDQAQEENKAIHVTTDPQFDAVRQKAREKIRQVLTPEQKPRFEDFLRRMDEERKRIGQ